MAAPQQQTPAAQTQQFPIPNAAVLSQASRLAILQDKPILLDYYLDTVNGKAFIGQDAETNEKMLFKSNDEFTSMIQKVYQVAEDFIVMTENSIYIISGKTLKKKIISSSFHRDDDE
jgi:hypothetical protein